MLLCFFMGMISVFPASFMEWLIMPFAPSPESHPVWNGLFDGFLVAGFSEELCKLLLLMLVIWRSPYFDEYFDGIIYAAYLSLGFACVENISYVFGSADAVSTAFMRGILAVPAHFLFAVAMGYHLSLAKFDPANRKSHLLRALLYPLVLHGTYDALLMISSNLTAASGQADIIVGSLCSLLFIVFVIFDVKLWRHGLKRIKSMQERSRQDDFDPYNPFKDFRWDV